MFIDNQIDQVPPFRYINPDNEMSPFFVRGEFLGYMKYLMRSGKRAAEAVGIWTKDHWYVKRVDSLYTMVSRLFNFKINKRFDSLIWSSVVRDFYTSRGYIIGKISEEQDQAW